MNYFGIDYIFLKVVFVRKYFYYHNSGVCLITCNIATYNIPSIGYLVEVTRNDACDQVEYDEHHKW